MSRALLALLVAVGVGCTASPAPTPSPMRSTILPSPTSSAPDLVSLDPIVLTIDLSEPRAIWDLNTFIPFGSGHSALGFEPSHESAPIGPNSFAIAPDGSVWIIDAAKQRVAHFAQSGELIGEVTDSVGSGSLDMAFVGSTLWVISLHHKGIVFPILPNGRRSAPDVITDEDRLVRVRHFIPTPHGLYAVIDGTPADPSQGVNGIFRVDLPGDAYIHESLGFSLRNRTLVNFYEDGDARYTIQYFSRGRETDQPIGFKFKDTELYGQRRLGGLFGLGGLGDYVVLGNDVFFWSEVSAAKPDGRGGYVGGRFLLRVGQSPLLLERLPDPTYEDETQVRHIALGPDGHIYLMQIDKDGVRIYRRP
jgi:hypothetical protein